MSGDEDWLAEVNRLMIEARLVRAGRYVAALRRGVTLRQIANVEGLATGTVIQTLECADLMHEARAIGGVSREITQWKQAEAWYAAKKAERDAVQRFEEALAAQREADRLLEEEERRAAEAVKFARARRCADAQIAGETLDVIGQREGVTRERIRQIIEEAGLTEEVKAAKAEQQEARAAEERAEFERRARERRLSVNDSRVTNVRQWTDEAVIEAVAEWLLEGGSGTSVDWIEEGRSPSVALITHRLGWANAIRLAGWEPQREHSGHRSDRWSEEECVDTLVTFLTDPAETNGGYDAYDRWARSRLRRTPSSQTIRNRFGSWSAAKRLALQRMSEADDAIQDALG